MAQRVPLRDVGAALTERLEKYKRATLEDAAERAMADLMDGAETKAVQLAPVDTGNLEASTVVDVLRRARSIIGRLAFTAPYAAEVHELPDHARGPKTQQKPGNELGLAGPKYLERVLRALQATAARSIAEAIQKVFRR